ncbi:MOP flippase family protein [Saccharibacillus kuerlensis]|uniref:Lipopolysaccharide biosynthesis protein n=1 Tax=Saccharibacillus kuerlensis TaxID=459527 RepID=A0ABQ2L823_9BACL|nr:MOP flippase family protein [Saccharibacillus kuerlensis]GGO06397.1 lipopolysaccharide biosynthesis protein [Saccharibacillus kuerlensis]
MSSLRKKGIKAAKWSSIATIVTIVIQLLQLVALSRLLSPVDYGLMSMTMVVVAAAVNLTDAGISNAIIHRQDVTKNHLSSLYILNLFTGAFIAVIIFFSAPLVAWFYQESELINPIRWMALLCLLPAFGQQFEVLFRKELKFDNIAKIQIASYFVGFVLAVGGAAAGMGVYALVLSNLGNAFVKSMLLLIQGWKKWRPALHFATKDLKGYLSFGAYQMSSNVIQSLMSNIDYIIIGRLYSAQALGYYSFAFQLCTMPVLKLAPLINTVSLPLYAKMQDNLERLKSGYIKTVNLVSYLNAPIYMGLLVTAPVLVPFVFGDKWEPSIILIQVLAVAMLLRSLVVPIQPLLQAKGRMDMYFRYTLMGMSVQVPGLAIGTYVGGIMGTCIAYVLIQFAMVVIQYQYAMRKTIGPCLREYLRSMAPGLAYGLIMVVGVLIINYLSVAVFSHEANFIIQVAVGALIYFAVIFLFNKELFQNVKNRLISKTKLAK